MPGKRSLFLRLLFVFCLTLAVAFAKSEPLVPVSGTILDATSHKPLIGVEVSRKDTRTYSDKSGRYSIRLPVGICNLTFRFGERATIHKSAIVRAQDHDVVLDALIPLAGGATRRSQIVMEHGSRSTRGGGVLASDYPADSMISLSDAWANDPQFLNLGLGGLRAHSPVWGGPAGEIFLGVEGVVHKKEAKALLGLYRFDSKAQKTYRLAGGEPLLFAAFDSSTNSVVTATGHDIFVIHSPESDFKRIHSESNGNFLLSVAWGPDGRIYFTVDEPVRLTATTSYTRSRIASIKADGADLNPGWAADPAFSYRYPKTFGKEIVYSKFATDGKGQSLWSREPQDKEARLVLKDALRAVQYDSISGILYYIFRNDLHYRNLKTGFDVTIQNSVENADMRSLNQ